MIAKTCTKCGETKPLDGFHRDARKKYGRTSQCKPCEAEYGLRHRAENRNKIAERKRRYTEENREFINAEAANRMRETRESARMFVTVPHGTRFSPEEDACLMEDNGMTTYQKAVHLGRPFDSCEVRIRRLRKKLKA